MDALRRADHISQYIGVRAIEVHAIDDAARRFYLKYGFVSLRNDQYHLFLSMQVVRLGTGLWTPSAWGASTPSLR